MYAEPAFRKRGRRRDPSYYEDLKEIFKDPVEDDKEDRGYVSPPPDYSSSEEEDCPSKDKGRGSPAPVKSATNSSRNVAEGFELPPVDYSDEEAGPKLDKLSDVKDPKVDIDVVVQEWRQRTMTVLREAHEFGTVSRSSSGASSLNVTEPSNLGYGSSGSTTTTSDLPEFGPQKVQMRQLKTNDVVMKKPSKVRFSKVREEIYETSDEEEEEVEDSDAETEDEDDTEEETESDDEEEEDIDVVLEKMDDFLEVMDEKSVDGDELFNPLGGVVRPTQRPLTPSRTLASIMEVDELEPLDYYSEPRLFTGLGGGAGVAHGNQIQQDEASKHTHDAIKPTKNIIRWISSSVKKANILKRSQSKENKTEIFFDDGRRLSMDDGGSSVSSASYGSCSSGGHEEVLLRIHVPELNVERCLTFHSHDLVWTVKQTTLTSLPKELRESFNYGLFCPPQNGRAGKFLDEERPLSDYPLPSPMGYLELKYKRRVYKMLKLEEKALRSLHTRANLRRFLEWVKEANVEKVSKLCSKGLDPNFHCQETGDTPLTIAARGNLKGRKSCAGMIVALVNGGALLDYRTKGGLTAMHRAVQADNLQAVRTLLDLGASPNYRDHRGLTPLYYCVTYAKDPLVCEALLHDYAVIGVADHQGWQETHQACRNKLVQHLEHLLFYGADLNGQNASGNTPLHVCAVNNLEDCARVLLFRGCDKNALNFANQNPYQVAVISGNLDLAEVINKHQPEDVVPFKSPPRYNPRRRVSGAPLLRATSDPRLEGGGPVGHKPPSPAPSARSIPPFSSASSLSEASTGSGSTNSSTQHSEAGEQEQQTAHHHPGLSYDPRPGPQSSSVNEALSDTSSGVCSSYQSSAGDHSTTSMRQPQQPPMAPSTINTQMKSSPKQKPVPVNEQQEDEEDEDDEESESESSSSSSSEEGEVPATTFDVGTMVVCVQQQVPQDSSQLAINPGDIIQVSGSTDDGLLEGVIRGVTGTFPPSMVQPVRLRNPQAIRDSLIAAPPPRRGGRILGRESSFDGSSRAIGHSSNNTGTHYGTAPRVKKTTQQQHLLQPEPRQVVLHRGKKGFGFVLRGAKATSPLMDRSHGGDRGGPALQYLDDVDPGGVADLAGLKPGDYLLKINGEDVSQASHEHVVTLIRKSADLVEMTVITPTHPPTVGGAYSPHKPPPFGVTTAVKRGCQTLPRKHNFSRSLSQNTAPPAPPPRDPTTSLSVGRARARSVVGNLQQQSSDDYLLPSMSGAPPKLASIKARPASAHRMTASQIEEFISSHSAAGSLPPSPTNNDPHTPKVYASVAEMKKAKALRSRLPVDIRGLHKVFHSTPDLQNGLDPSLRNSLSQEDISNGQNLQYCPSDTSSAYHPPSSVRSMGAAIHNTRGDYSAYSAAGYFYDASQCQDNAATHGSLDHRRLRRSQSAINSSQLRDSPPLPPAGQVIRVDIGRSKSEYASVAQTVVSPTNPEVPLNSAGVMSSFRPSDCAKLYASPEQIKSVGYHRNPEMLAQLNQPPNGNRHVNGMNNAKSRSSSLPPTTNRPPVHRPSPEKDISVDSGIYSSTHSTFRSAGEPELDDDEDLPLPPPPPEAEITYARPQNNKIVVADHANVMSTSYTMGQPSPYSRPNNGQMSASFCGSSQQYPEPYSSEEESVSQYEDTSSLRRSNSTKKKKHTVAFAPSVKSNNRLAAANHDVTSPYAAPVNLTNQTPASPPLPPPPENLLSHSENFSDLIAKKAAEKRLRRENSGNTSAPGSTSASPSKKVAPANNTSKGLSDAILESALFNKQKEKANGSSEKIDNSNVSNFEKRANGTAENVPSVSDNKLRKEPVVNVDNSRKLKTSKSFPNDFGKSDEAEKSSSRRVSPVNSDQDTRQQDKGSFVTVINTESNTIATDAKPSANSLSKSNSIEETSVSSESSEDGSDRTWILTNEKGDKPESNKESNTKRSGSLTRNAVSLAKLPPPQEITEQVTPTEAAKIKEMKRTTKDNYMTNVSERESQSLPYQSLPPSHPLATSHPLPYHLQGAIHPSNTHVGQAKFSTLQRPSSKRFSKAGSDPSAGGQTATRNTSAGGTLIRSQSITRDELNLNSGSATLDRNRSRGGSGKSTEYEKSIDESLQLIRMHMNSLNEVNNLAGIPSSKKFSDEVDNADDCSPNANKQPGDRSSSSSMEVLAPPPQFSDPAAQYRSKYRSGVDSDDDDDMPPIRVYKRSNRRLEEEFVAGGRDDRNFRSKTLDEWSTRDTTDWLESLFMPEYKDSFENKQIDGAKLLKINNESLINLGVRRVGHRVNMEKSLKRYRAVERIDL